MEVEEVVNGEMQILMSWASMLFLVNIQPHHLLLTPVHMLVISDQCIIHPHRAPVLASQMLLLVTPGVALVLKLVILHFPPWIIVFTSGTTIPFAT